MGFSQPSAAASRRSRRRLLALLTGALTVAAGFVGWRALGLGSGPDTPPPTYLAVERATYRVTVPAPGTLRAADRSEVRTSTSGTVGWAAPVGARVQAGEVVARLDTTALERTEREAVLALERARRTLDTVRADGAETERATTATIEAADWRLADAHAREANAAADLELKERLAAIGAETPNALRAARDALANARRERLDAEREWSEARESAIVRRNRAAADLANAVDAVEGAELALLRAREDLAAAELRTRVAGVVERVEAAAGSAVGANALVVSVVDDAVLHLAAQVDETEVSQVAPGQHAEVTAIAVPGLRLAGRVVAVSPTAHVTQNIPVFEVTIELENPELRLRPGMTAEAEIVLREVEDTVTVPSRALVRGLDLAQAMARAPVGAFAAFGAADPSGRPGGAAAAGAAERFGRGAGAGASLDGITPEVAEGAGARFGGAAPRGSEPARVDRAARFGALGDELAGFGARAGAQGAAGVGSASTGAGELVGLRVRVDGELGVVVAETIATVGANTVLRVDLPAGAEVEVPPPPTSAGAATPARSAGGGLFGIPGLGGTGGAPRFGVPGR